MSEPTQHAESFDEVLGRFLAELERGANREHLIRTYAIQYPEHAGEFREYAELPELLDRAVEQVDDQCLSRLGDFRILREISHGGMKTVYEAIQEPLERRVAVATIRRGRISAALRQRFLREQRVLAQLHETHIVPIFAAGEVGPIQYFAMPYIEGAALHHIIQIASHTEAWRLGSATPSLKELAQRVVHPSAGTDTAWDATGDTPHQELPAASADSAVGSPQLSLSREYYRSVANVMADVAESLQHAHDHGFLHRDLKPANIIVGTDERSWLIDFGLAGFLQTPDPPMAEMQAPHADDALTSTRGVLGTPGYMAPEQQAGESMDARTDVWGLGATLYELLTLRRAFPNSPRRESGSACSRRFPPSPRSVIGDIPRDLEAICMKSLREDPGDRYQATGEVSDDLHRWLRGEPTLAHPASALRRAYLWARRNKGWASAVAVSLIALFGLAVGGFLVQRARTDAETARADEQGARADAETARANELGAQAETETARANEQGARADAETARAETETARANEQSARADAQAARADEQQRQLLMLQVEHLLAPGQANGWSDTAWELERQVHKFRADDRLRNQATAILSGLDATQCAQFPEFGAQSMLFDPNGERLLMGSRIPSKGWPVTAKLWQVGEVELPRELLGAGWGPVAFSASGAPLQLTTRPEQNELVLVDLSKGEVVTRFAMPPASALQFTAGLQFTGELAVTADASSVAAVATSSDGRTSGILLWAAVTRNWQPLLDFRSASVLAFSPDGTLLAAGDEDGSIAIWSVDNGQTVASLGATRNAVQSLAFGRDIRAAVSANDAESSGHLVAAGYEGGAVTIWDVDRKVPRSHCRGHSYDVRGVAFSPDGVTLASSGREVRLWDVATGRLLLSPMSLSDGMYGLAFSPDGRKLAVGGMPHERRSVAVWELTAGRGIMSLRGLACPVSKTCFSLDGRYMAALAHNWDVAIWDLRTGFILHLLEAPRGVTADNAALAFSPDGTRFVFSAGSQAKAWDIVSGREVQRWELKEGFVDQLAFAASDRLLSLRAETQDGTLGPYSNVDPAEHPCVCRLRELPEQGQPLVLKEITEFNWKVFSAAASPTAEYFVIEGLAGSEGELRRVLKVFDAQGEELATLPTRRPADADGAVHIRNPTGNLLCVMTGDEGEAEMTLFEMPACRAVGKIEFGIRCLSSDGAYYGNIGLGFSLTRRGASEPAVVFDENQGTIAVQPEFDSIGTRLSWGRRDGTVMVADLPEVQRRLAELGLEW